MNYWLLVTHPDNFEVMKQGNIVKILLSGFSGFFAKNVINQYQGNDAQCKRDLSLSNLWSKINHNFSNNSSDLVARFQDMIARIRFAVKANKFGVTKIATSQAAVRLAHIAENTLSWALVGSNEKFMNRNVPHNLD